MVGLGSESRGCRAAGCVRSEGSLDPNRSSGGRREYTQAAERLCKTSNQDASVELVKELPTRETIVMITLSIIKADTRGYVGHSRVHPGMVEVAQKALDRAKDDLLDRRPSRLLWRRHLADYDAPPRHRVARHPHSRVGDLRGHDRDRQETQTLRGGTGHFSDAFFGNLRGMGPGYAEVEFKERPSEPVLCFLADKTEPGAWNLPLYKIFADPFNTAGLVIDPNLHEGFSFEVHDLFENKCIFLDCPAEIYDLLLFIGAPSRYVVKHVVSKALKELAAVTSTQRLSLIAGKYVGKDDPVMVVRCQSGLPAVGEAPEPFSFPHSVAGCMRGSHHAPLMPVSLDSSHPARCDGPRGSFPSDSRSRMAGSSGRETCSTIRLSMEPVTRRTT